MSGDVRDRQLSVLRSFVLRARRIREHSLAQDLESLHKMQSPSWTVHFTPATGETKVTLQLPPEEQVESAAARVRPLILQEELTHHANVMNALLYFTSQHNPPAVVIAALRELKKSWGRINPKGMTGSHYSVTIQGPDGEKTSLDDGALAFAWIYGDVVHADPERREEGREFGVEERYQAAVPLVARLMCLALYTLRIVEGFTKGGVIPDLGDVFEEEVSVKKTVFETDAEVFVAPFDENGDLPEPPDAGEDFGRTWTPFAEVFPSMSPQVK